MTYLLDTDTCIFALKRHEKVLKTLLSHRRADVAVRRGLVLVTNNQREFARVNGLKLENWTV